MRRTPKKIGFEERLGFFDAGFFQGSNQRVTGIVDERVDSPCLFMHPSNARAYGLLMANIEGHYLHAPPRSVSLTGSPHRSEDSESSPRQQFGSGPADSRRNPCHQSNLFSRHCFLLVFDSSSSLPDMKGSWSRLVHGANVARTPAST